MRLITFTIFIIIIISSLSAQDKNKSGYELILQDYRDGKINYEEAILQRVYYGFDKSKLEDRYRVEEGTPVKCATEIISEYYSNKGKISVRTSEEIQYYLSVKRNSATESFSHISPDGYFELNYEKSGPNAVPLSDANGNNIPDYIEWVAGYFDYSWKFSIDTLGNLPPPVPEGRYQIFFMEMDFYGYCEPVNWPSPETIIVMHRNYLGFPPNDDPEGNQKGAAKVTAIHEFKHALQIVYNLWQEPSWLLEMDATWMEDIGYDSVNDYYNYLVSSHIKNPGRAFADGSGYEDCIWMHYLTEKHGPVINRNFWQMRSSDPYEDVLVTFDKILQSEGSGIGSGLSEYFLWNYFCGRNFISGLPSYQEAEGYPDPDICETYDSLPESSSGCKRSGGSASFLRYNNLESQKYLGLNFLSEGSNSVYLIKYTDETAEIINLKAAGNQTLEYLLNSQYGGLNSLAVIAVVTTLVNDDYPFTLNLYEFSPAEFDHIPVKDKEQISSTPVRTALLTPFSLVNPDSLLLHYGLPGELFSTLLMKPDATPGQYEGLIPEPVIYGDVEYYFSIPLNEGGKFFYPESDTFRFYIGPDLKGPVVLHSPSENLTRFDFPHRLLVKASDNIEIDSLYLSYSLNGWQSFRQEFKLLDDSLFYADLELDSAALRSGDLIEYRITATDKSENKNITLLPESDFFNLSVGDGFMFQSSPEKVISEYLFSPTLDTVAVEEDIMIRDMNLFFSFDHPDLSDLECRITPPWGGMSFLFSRPGLNSSYIQSGESGFILDQDAYHTFESIYLYARENLDGVFKPSGINLDDFNDKSALGKWKLRILDKNPGSKGLLKNWGIILRGTLNLTQAKNEKKSVNEYRLYQNYPNPFNPATKITFSLGSDSFVRLKVYDILGREVSLIKEEQMPGGYHEIEFSAADPDKFSGTLPSGIYFYRLEVYKGIKDGEIYSETRKFVLVK